MPFPFLTDNVERLACMVVPSPPKGFDSCLIAGLACTLPMFPRAGRDVQSLSCSPGADHFCSFVFHLERTCAPSAFDQPFPLHEHRGL